MTHTFDALQARFGFPTEGDWCGATYAVSLAADVLESMASDRSPLHPDAIAKRLLDAIPLLPVEVMERLTDDDELRGLVIGLALGIVFTVMTEPRDVPIDFAPAKEAKPCICSGPIRLAVATAKHFEGEVAAAINQHLDGLSTWSPIAWMTRAT